MIFNHFFHMTPSSRFEDLFLNRIEKENYFKNGPKMKMQIMQIFWNWIWDSSTTIMEEGAWNSLTGWQNSYETAETINNAEATIRRWWKSTNIFWKLSPLSSPSKKDKKKTKEWRIVRFCTKISLNSSANVNKYQWWRRRCLNWSWWMNNYWNNKIPIYSALTNSPLELLFDLHYTFFLYYPFLNNTFLLYWAPVLPILLIGDRKSCSFEDVQTVKAMKSWLKNEKMR